MIPSTHPQLEVIIAQHFNEGTYRLQKRCTVFASANPGWDKILQPSDQKEFYQRLTSLVRWVSRGQHQAMRLEQLRAGGYVWWVYRAMTCNLHEKLDGIALCSDHPFWLTHYPANGWDCDCEVYGARTLAGIRRVGGDCSKELPCGWNEKDPVSGQLPWVSPEFVGQAAPSFVACLEELLRRNAMADGA